MNEYMSITDRMRGWDKQTEQLEKENAELKEKLEHRNCVDCSNHHSNIKLIKAKELLKRLMHELVVSNRPYNEVELLVKDVEKFLK